MRTAKAMGPTVRGVGVDRETRCAHYRSPRDVVAIRMKCCGEWYACRECHDALAAHPVQLWPRREWDEAAVLCGVCGTAMSIRAYVGGGVACPSCNAAFNPGCRAHHRLYFEV